MSKFIIFHFKDFTYDYFHKKISSLKLTEGVNYYVFLNTQTKIRLTYLSHFVLEDQSMRDFYELTCIKIEYLKAHYPELKKSFYLHIYTNVLADALNKSKSESK